MNEVEYCTGCAMSMIITCKIDYFISLSATLSILPFPLAFTEFLFLTLYSSPPPPPSPPKGHQHAIVLKITSNEILPSRVVTAARRWVVGGWMVRF